MTFKKSVSLTFGLFALLLVGCGSDNDNDTIAPKQEELVKCLFGDNDFSVRDDCPKLSKL